MIKVFCFFCLVGLSVCLRSLQCCVISERVKQSKKLLLEQGSLYIYGQQFVFIRVSRCIYSLCPPTPCKSESSVTLRVADVSTPLRTTHPPTHPTYSLSLSAARAAAGAGAWRPEAVHQADVQNWWAGLKAGSLTGWVFTLLSPPLAPC